MKSSGKMDTERDTNRVAGVHMRVFHDRRGFDGHVAAAGLAHANQRGKGNDEEAGEACAHLETRRWNRRGEKPRVYSTGRSGITSARGSGPKSSPNLIGGRSWNMKSHFQRSIGFDDWSQWRAETGRRE